MNQIFRVSGINYGEAVEWLDGELSKTKATEEERLTAQLLFEECFTRMEESCADAETFSACRRQIPLDVALLRLRVLFLDSRKNPSTDARIDLIVVSQKTPSGSGKGVESNERRKKRLKNT